MNKSCPACIHLDNGICTQPPLSCLNFDRFQLGVIEVRVSDFETKYISRVAFDEMKARAEAAEAKAARLEEALKDANEDADHLSMCIEFDVEKEAAIKAVNDHHNRLTKPQQEADKEN